MKVKVSFYFIIAFISCSTGFEQESNKLVEIESIKEEVWTVVEKRNITWTENDFNGHMAIYHPEFRRWSLHSKSLMTKEIFASFWDGIKINEATKKNRY